MAPMKTSIELALEAAETGTTFRDDDDDDLLGIPSEFGRVQPLSIFGAPDMVITKMRRRRKKAEEDPVPEDPENE